MDDFLFLCRAFGQLEDLTQSGGGNISVKISESISIIKSSGVSLSDVSRTYGFTILDHARVVEGLVSQTETPLDAVVISGPKPSLETHFHCFLKKYVVHIHPTILLPHLCSGDPCCIPYEKPGFHLSKTIYNRYTQQSCIHLANHGIILTADTIPELLTIAHEEYERFRPAHSISLREFWSIQSEYPDSYIYKLSRAETDAYLPILKRYNIRKITPDVALFLHDSVLIENDFLFIRAPTKQKCLSILEILRSYCECTEQCRTTLTELQAVDVRLMPSEQYRKSLP
jgi:ribulose-5-phosphate 4-epimerase/fuculose-1-phosphate aldolase